MSTVSISSVGSADNALLPLQARTFSDPFFASDAISGAGVSSSSSPYLIFPPFVVYLTSLVQATRPEAMAVEVNAGLSGEDRED